MIVAIKKSIAQTVLQKLGEKGDIFVPWNFTFDDVD